jgi:hypothetical protein
MIPPTGCTRATGRQDPLRGKEVAVFLVTRGLPVLAEFGLLVYCLIDCVQTPEDKVRNLRKVWWIMLIIVLPLAGSIAWLGAGRPRRSRPSPHQHGPAMRNLGRGQGRVLGPDDDPEFLARISEQHSVDEEHERLLSAWEEDLRRREAELRGETPGEAPPTRSTEERDDQHPEDDTGRADR